MMLIMMQSSNNNTKAEEKNNDGDVNDKDKEAAAVGEEKGDIDNIDDNEGHVDNDDNNNRIICGTQLGTVYTLYPWRENSYSNSSI